MDGVFASAAKVLSPLDGLLVFSVEELPEGTCDLFLLPAGRFGHSMRYLLRQADKYGFQVYSCERDDMRTQGGVSVKSLTVVMRKAAGTLPDSRS